MICQLRDDVLKRKEGTIELQNSRRAEMGFLLTTASSMRPHTMWSTIIKTIIIIWLILTSVSSYANDDKGNYWNSQRKGANFFNETPTEDWFKEDKEVSVEFARLAPDKLHSEHRDFLLGDADAFERISPSDFQKLKDTLDQAQNHGIRIVIAPLSLPGSRWRQKNNNQNDLRIWQNEEYQNQAIRFWRQLSFLHKDHPAIIGYNILNEPHPELLFGITDFREINFHAWYKSVKGTTADLNLFYHKISEAIREEDPNTPIILDTGLYATPWAIRYLTPITDPRILYSFHMYEPYEYTTKRINNGQYQYPGFDSFSTYWNEDSIKQFLQPISDWQMQYQIPSSQILVGEFGCARTSEGANRYLESLIRSFDTQNWHWAFYSFREDCWDSIDYELGPGTLDKKYWEARAHRESLNPYRHDNPLFDVIKKDIQKPRELTNLCPATTLPAL